MYATEMYAQDTKNYVKNVHNSNICFNPQLDINHMSVNSKWTNKFYVYIETSLVGQTVKRLPTMRENWVQSLDQEDLLEKEMATHSSILAWKIP